MDLSGDGLIALLGLVAQSQSNQGWGSGGWGSGGKGWGGGGKGWGKSSWGNGGKSWGKGNFAQRFGNKKADDKNMITLLAGSLGKKLKRPVTKDDLAYVFIEEESGGKKTFQATVASSEFVKDVQYIGKESPSKMEAKQDAAKTALKAEFPDAFKATPKQNGPKQNWAPPKKADSTGINFKQKLCEAISTILGRPMAKTDLVSDITKTGNSFTAKFQIPELTTETYEGKSNDKKSAEANAAKKALVELGPIADSKREEKGKRKHSKEETAAIQAAKKEAREKLQAFDASQKVYVGGLKEAVTVDQLKTYFAKAGKIQMIERMGAKAAIVVFSSKAESEKAIKTLNGKTLDSCTLLLDKWAQSEKTKKAKKTA